MRRSQSVYQFKITLDHVRPTVWRRIVVPDTYTLWDLSIAIIEAMGWSGGHLHGFKTIERYPIVRINFGIPDPDYPDDDVRPMWKEKIADWFVHRIREKLKHEYDYGDGWEHSVQFEKIFTPEKGMHYPMCIAGKNACPPDDVGGPWGYERFLEIIRNPKHPDYKDTVAWGGAEEDFDLAEFHCSVDVFSNARERRELLAMMRKSH
jgi:hypothetical protein